MTRYSVENMGKKMVLSIKYGESMFPGRKKTF